MPSDFIIVTGEKKKAEPEDNSPKSLVEKWFSFVKNVSPQTVAKLTEQIQRKLETGVGQDLFSKISPKYKSDVQFKHCIEETIREQWDSLTPEDRLLVRCPNARSVGESVELPKLGTGVIIRRELTRQFGIEMVFQLQDGSLFKREVFD
jgi:hypothetical protein